MKAPLKAWMIVMLAGTSFAAESSRPLSFVNDIQPILTKAGCNAGVCHAKAITGQRGFRLSVLGFEPEEDYEAIVKQGKGRRVFPPAPEESLLITKGAAIVPHTGGKKLEPGSEDYKMLVRWIAEGMNYTQKDEAKLNGIVVEPGRITMKIKTAQQLKVTARYSDGSSRDVTKLALFEANDRAMAEAGDQGLVKTLDIPGNVAVMVRFGGRVSVCSVSIPLGAPVDSLPPVKNFIDQHVFANLKQIGVPPS
ncbi:MAG: S-layer protein, partial [Planctomycetales bacterium 12-60-4]